MNEDRVQEMLRRLRYRAEHETWMMMSAALSLCTVLLIAVLVLPLFGPRVAALTAAVTVLGIVGLCYLACVTRVAAHGVRAWPLRRERSTMAMRTTYFWQPWIVLLRLYLGWSWLAAGWEKVWDPAWKGSGPAVAGFLTAALKSTHFGWYRSLVEAVFLPNTSILAALVSWAELLVGFALVLGLFVSLAALAGIAMNAAFLLAGTVSTNSTYIMIELVLLFAGAGLVWGLDGVIARRWARQLPGLISGRGPGLPSWLSWSIAAALVILGTVAFQAARTMAMPEFSNPARQLSRVLVFAGGFYAAKAWRDTRRAQRQAAIREDRVAA